MFTDEQLRRMTQYKQPKRRAEPIGRLLRGFADHRHQLSQGLLLQLKSAIDEVVDDLFQDHCRSITIECGTVTIGIDDPALVYQFRRKYLFLLREHLVGAVPQAKICDVRFCAFC